MEIMGIRIHSLVIQNVGTMSVVMLLLMKGMKVAIFIAIIQITASERICMQCDNVVHPTACSTVVRCSEHEECFLSKYNSANDEILYSMGCKDKRECSHLRGRRFLTSNALGCTECCNNGNLCNLGGLCGTRHFSSHGNLICYGCEQSHHPETCSVIKLCGRDESCFIGQKTAGLLEITVFETGCANTKLECPSFNALSLFGKRSSGRKCAQCCNSSLCNDNCSLHNVHTTVPVPTTHIHGSKPHIVQIGGVDSVHVNSDVRLFCSATGDPVPTVGWNVLTTDGPMSNTYIEGNGHILVIENYQTSNNGKYECWARNSHGISRKPIVLSAT